MKVFKTPRWDSTPLGDQNHQLFKDIKTNLQSKTKKNNSKIKNGHFKKAKHKKLKVLKNTNLQINDKDTKSNVNKQVLKTKAVNSKFSKKNTIEKPSKIQNDDIISNNNTYNKKSKQITHQTLFLGNSRKIHKKLNKIKESSKNKTKTKQELNKTSPVESANNFNKISKKQKYVQTSKEILQSKEVTKSKMKPSLRERMLEKLTGARFRYLNEQMYTNLGKNSKKYFENDLDAYEAYHEGYRQQVARWALNPLDVIIERIKKLPRSHIIADFGCGEAKLAKSVKQTVHSFDLVALNDCVTTCDMSHVPLENGSVNVVVFCLSLMGTNLNDYLLEANRVLKMGGLLKIAEVESRFKNVDSFIKDVQRFGFSKTAKDFSHNLFCFLDFVKKNVGKQTNKLPNVTLNPCLYKKR